MGTGLQDRQQTRIEEACSGGQRTEPSHTDLVGMSSDPADACFLMFLVLLKTDEKNRAGEP